MSWCLRISKALIEQIRSDLKRPHSHAAERVGVVFAQMGNVQGKELLLLPTRYEPVLDQEYIEDRFVGARIGSAPIRRAMQTILSEGLGAFHVHTHEHRGRPRFSRVDLQHLPPLVQSFRSVGPRLAHGALLLSDDQCACLVWLPGKSESSADGRIAVVGRPMQFYEAGALYG